MRVAHISGPLARRGGPPGYLWQLADAYAGDGAHDHIVTFPPRAAHMAAPRPSLAVRTRSRLGRVKRALTGPPVFFRPPAEDVRRDRGVIEAHMTSSMQDVVVDSGERIDAALASGADVLFAHEPAVAARLLERRRPHQQIWLMLHSPMPIALDMAWSWCMPEWDWQELAALPDTRRWIRWELDVCAGVDRVITACPEAVAELARVDERYASLPFDYVLTGAAGPPRAFPNEAGADLRRRWRLPPDGPVGLFLGSPLPYRGLDVLAQAVAEIPASIHGLIAVAGPRADQVPAHPRLRALGPVREVGDLMQAADFLINVNRFSLFDLSTIEAAEAGLPLLMHATGGNRRFEALGAGCVMAPNLDAATIAERITSVFTMSDAARRMLGEASRQCYRQHLTPESMLARHMGLYDRAAAERRGVAAS